MKNYLLLLTLVLLTFSCNNAEQNCEVVSNGFAPFEGQTVMMASQSSVDAFKVIDKAWADRDYEALKSLIADDSMLEFEDGSVATNGEEFVAKIEAEYQSTLTNEDTTWGDWTNTYAFAIKPSKPEGSDYSNNRGEWVNAGFQGSDGFYMEWYQIEDGKLIAWSQAKRDSPSEKQ